MSHKSFPKILNSYDSGFGTFRAFDTLGFNQVLYHLSYEAMEWTVLESNQRHMEFHSIALPSELTVLNERS